MVYILLANGFEDIEALYPTDVLRRCGVNVVTVGVGGEYITSSNKVIVKPDIGIDEVKLENHIDMLVLPGGPGRGNLRDNDKSLELIKHCCGSDVPIAAICAAPEILGGIGFLKGKKATCFPGIEPKLNGAEYVDAPVVVDGKLITAKGAGCSEAFAFALAEFLCGKEKADEIKRKICSIK
ncbi:MAG: DJ-1/PfpI family protein [Oscillospiraceae bacterium]|nr:DJ-1/PfpI family protein [Oscillospiraceae bacterium]